MRDVSPVNLGTVLPARAPLTLLRVLFFLSGISGLIYQVVWLRMLTRMLGSTVYASSTVLASFMAGLALGSYLCGRVADRVRSPVRLYGLLEIGIAACGIALPWVFDGLLPAYRALFAAIGDSPAVFLAVRAGIVFTLLLVPTALMGATLPALSACVGREAAGFEKRVAWLYGLNTLGAMLGALAAGLVLLGLCGETWTILIAAALNVGVGLFAIKRRRYLETSHDNRDAQIRSSDRPLAQSRSEPSARFSDTVRRLVLLSFAISGFACLGFEVIWTRQLQLFMGTSIYAFSAMLVLYLAGLGLGSLLGGESDDGGHAQWILGLLQCILGAFGLVSQCWLASAAPGNPFEVLSLLHSFGPALAIFLFALISGMMFPRAVNCFARGPGRRGESLGILYSANTLGCILGSLVTGFFLIPAVGSGRAAVILALLNVIAGLVIWGFAVRSAPHRAIGYAVPLIALVATILVPAAARGYDVALLRCASANLGDDAELCFHREGAVAATTAFRNKSNHLHSTLWVNGVGMTHLGTVTKLMAHLPVMMHGHAEKMLVICFGMGTTVRSAATYPDISITSVELVPEVYDCFGYFHPDGPSLWGRPNIRAVVDDGRNFLLLRDEQFDIITIDPPPPVHSAGTVNLYTREFFELCRRRLRPDGIVCLWIPAVAESDLKFIMASFGSVFDHTSVWTAPDCPGFYCIGQLTPRELDPAVVQAFLSRPEIRHDLTEYGFRCEDASDLQRLRLLNEHQFRDLIRSSPVMTDDRPYTEFPLWRRLLFPEHPRDSSSPRSDVNSFTIRPQTSEDAPRHRPCVGGLTAFALRRASLGISAAVVQKPLNHWGKPSGVASLRTRWTRYQRNESAPRRNLSLRGNP